MKFFKILLLNIFLISVVVNVFGMEKIDPSRDEAFKYLNIACKINFSDSDQKIVEQLFVACKSDDASEIDEIVTGLSEKNNADKIVCMTLFLFVYDSSENLAKEFLAQKKFKNFIFKALSSQEVNDAYQILHKMIEVCTNVGLFLFLEEFINQILLESFERDEDKNLSAEIIDFVVDSESFFKEALEKIADTSDYKTLKISINKLFEKFDQDCLYDFNRDDDADEEFLSGSDDKISFDECSSDEDSDGECARKRDWGERIEYLRDHKDQ